MNDIIPRTWISGTPRGYGDRKIEDQWVSALRAGLGEESFPSAPVDAPLEVTLEFCVFPRSAFYGGQVAQHGPDLDNLVKMTIDGLTPLRGRGLGIVADDGVVYVIHSSKQVVERDEDAGAWITVRVID